MSTVSPRYGLNHMVCPSLTIQQFLETANQLGAETIEFRNDIGTNSLTDLTTAKAAGEQARSLGITVLSINALYPFNIWNADRAAQAVEMAKVAQACGAVGLVMCPLNDGSYTQATPQRFDMLKEALLAITPILEDHNLIGFIEPLGFPISSLRTKREAVEAIEAIGQSNRFKLVHDTFHHRGAGEDDYFPDHTGLVHISGLEDQDVSFDDMLDSHRLLVGPKDRLGNVEQLHQLHKTGFNGPVSFEPFSEQVWGLNDPATAVLDSIRYLNGALNR